jgi:hypothetical protein
MMMNTHIPNEQIEVNPEAAAKVAAILHPNGDAADAVKKRKPRSDKNKPRKPVAAPAPVGVPGGLTQEQTARIRDLAETVHTAWEAEQEALNEYQDRVTNTAHARSAFDSYLDSLKRA